MKTKAKKSAAGKMDKSQVVEILREISTLLEMKGENVFKIRAYDNAARILEGNPSDLKTLIETGELEKLKGIGEHISRIIHDVYEKGKSRDYEELRKGFPPSLFELFRIPGLGAKRIKLLYEKLHIKSVGELEYACKENRLLDLEGFGARSQEKILEGIGLVKKSAGHFLIDFAKAESAKFVAYLKKQKGVLKIEVAGSIRRCKEIIKDIDILVSSKNAAEIHKAFVKYPEVESVVAHGDTKSSVVLKSGMNCDLRTVAEAEFPYALYYFTGSKEHNVAVRTLAKKHNLKINEYGLFKGARNIPCKDEADIFKHIGLHYIPPEVRENQGEVELAAKREFPPLVEQKQIRGIFHVHSTYSDGVAPLEKMIGAAQNLGYEYIGISDHSQSAKYAKGLEPERLRQQWKELDSLQKQFKIRIFKGIESDILPDGKLDYPESVLSQFDFVIGSIHSRFNMSEKEMTERIKRAMENKHLTFVGHPTGRLLLARDPYPVDIPKLIDIAKKVGVAMELNANPHRLDLDWRMCRYAKEKGVPVSINPDAHSIEGLKDVPYGVGIARKGWLEKKETPEQKKKRVLKIITRLWKAYPDAKCALHFSNPLQLLVATILSAQCTDKRVNMVTPALFKKYKTAEDLANANPKVFAEEIRSTGFYQNKTKSILAAAKEIVKRFHGKVPNRMEDLVTLPGIGRKTANVILGNAFGVPGLTVDTHMIRLNQRLGLTQQKDAVKIEFDLMPLVPQKEWTDYSHLIIHHGRNRCFARKPDCPHCEIRDLCPFPHKTPPKK
jgi:DNA polymerase (family 10)